MSGNIAEKKISKFNSAYPFLFIYFFFHFSNVLLRLLSMGAYNVHKFVSLTSFSHFFFFFFSYTFQRSVKNPRRYVSLSSHSHAFMPRWEPYNSHIDMQYIELPPFIHHVVIYPLTSEELLFFFFLFFFFHFIYIYMYFFSVTSSNIHSPRKFVNPYHTFLSWKKIWWRENRGIMIWRFDLLEHTFFFSIWKYFFWSFFFFLHLYFYQLYHLLFFSIS